jgi:hypothetical protein
MQHQRIPDEAPSVRDADEQTDKVVMMFVLEGDGWPWSEAEIARELGDQANAEDALRRLIDTGLLHRLGEFVFPTRTARRAAEIEVGTI